MPPYLDRNDAGRQLAGLLSAFRGRDVVVLSPPGAGVPVAYALASTLRVLLDVILIRPLSVPRRPDLVYGLLGEDRSLLIDTAAVADGAIADPERVHTEQEQENILRHNAFDLRGHRPRVSLDDRTVVIAEEFVTDATALRDACRMARLQGAIRIAVAVSVGDPRELDTLSVYADKIVCLEPAPRAAPDTIRELSTTNADIAAMLAANHAAEWSTVTTVLNDRSIPPIRSFPLRDPCA
ncbi:phosphoribosyltransferase family protein [Nocardia sp. NPDC005978]|uniref:phosphoribosyltransferase family protein n=1 Tax=unclassified Nocardia TaxID=2637762 RepID=UPI0033A7593F